MLLGGPDEGEVAERQPRGHGPRLPYLVVLVEEVLRVERAVIREALGLAPGRLGLATPPQHALAARAQALEQDIGIRPREVVVPRLLRRVGAEVHVPPVVEVQELQRVDQRRLARVVGPDDLHGARQVDLGEVVSAGADEDELLGALGHGRQGSG